MMENLREDNSHVEMKWKFPDQTKLKSINRKLHLSTLRLNLSSLFKYYCQIYYSDISSQGCRYWQLVDIPNSTETDQPTYSFSILSNDIQKFENKNYSIDSMFLDNKPITLQTRIVPYVCSNIFVEAPESGEYNIYGHVDLYDFLGHYSLPFSHKFQIKN